MISNEEKTNKKLQLKISAQEKVIKNLQREVFNLTNMLKKTPGSIYWKNKEGVYLGHNDYVTKMAGGKDIIGKTDFDLPWSTYADEITKNDQLIIASNSSIEFEEMPTLANGKQIIMLSRKTPLQDYEGITIGILGVSIDITERKKLEMVQQQARDAAEAAYIAKTNFIANMSYDIRNSLTGFIGMTQILEQQMKDPQQKLYALWLKENGDMLLKLINRILM